MQAEQFIEKHLLPMLRKREAYLLKLAGGAATIDDKFLFTSHHYFYIIDFLEDNRDRWKEKKMPETDHLNHKPDADGIKKIERLRAAFIGLEKLFDELVPKSRELSIAKTELESARMWAVKGIAMQYPADELKVEP